MSKHAFISLLVVNTVIGALSVWALARTLTPERIKPRHRPTEQLGPQSLITTSQANIGTVYVSEVCALTGNSGTVYIMSSDRGPSLVIASQNASIELRIWDGRPSIQVRDSSGHRTTIGHADARDKAEQDRRASAITLQDNAQRVLWRAP